MSNSVGNGLENTTGRHTTIYSEYKTSVDLRVIIAIQFHQNVVKLGRALRPNLILT